MEARLKGRINQMIHYVGQNFSKSISLDLLPFIEIDSTKHVIVSMVYHDINMYHSTSFQSIGIPPKIAVGPDVHSIQYEVVVMGGFNANLRYSGTIRVDRLILLNLAKQLLK